MTLRRPYADLRLVETHRVTLTPASVWVYEVSGAYVMNFRTSAFAASCGHAQRGIVERIEREKSDTCRSIDPLHQVHEIRSQRENT